VDDKPGNSFKVKSKYESITKAVLNTMGWGDFYGGKNSNLSGYSGDLATVATLVKEIQAEVENHEAAISLKAADAAAQKEKLNSITKDVFDTKPKPLKTPRQKSLDGTIIDRISSSKLPRKSETEMMIEAVLGHKNKKERLNREEEDAERIMKAYFINAGITKEVFDVTEQTMAVLGALGMETLISIYCQSGKKFDGTYFKEQLKELTGASPTTPILLIDIHKVFNFLNDIRLSQCNPANNYPDSNNLSGQKTNSSTTTRTNSLTYER